MSRLHALPLLAAVILGTAPALGGGYASVAVSAQRGLRVSSACPSNLQTDRLGTQLPVVFVHGWTGSPRDFTAKGTPAMGAVVQDLGEVWEYAFDYSAINTAWVTDPGIGPALAVTIRCVSDASRAAGGAGKVVIVAHSMGGLAIRCALSPACSGGPELTDRVGLVVTLGTPNLGSQLEVGAGVSATERILSYGLEGACKAGASLAHSLVGLCEFFASAHSPGAVGFTPGSRQLAALPTLPSTLPVLAIAGRVELTTTVFDWQTPLGDIGDIPVDEHSALTEGHRVGALGGTSTVDCGDLQLPQTDPVLGLNVGGLPACWHGTETYDHRFEDLVVRQVRAYQQAGPVGIQDIPGGGQSAALLVSDVLNVRSAPNPTAPVIGTVRAGQRVLVACQQVATTVSAQGFYDVWDGINAPQRGFADDSFVLTTAAGPECKPAPGGTANGTCGRVGFKFATEQVTDDIRAVGVDCLTARWVVAGSQYRAVSQSADAGYYDRDGFRCVGDSSLEGLLPPTLYRCARGTASVLFSRR